MDIFIIQHSETGQFHVPEVGQAFSTLPGAVQSLVARDIDATHYQSRDDEIIPIPVAVRPLAPSRRDSGR